MKIIMKSLTEQGVEDRDYREVIEIFIDGKRVFSVGDGEPEDSNLCRDFNDCWKIPDLLKMAYEAGKKGEELIIETEQVDDLYEY